MDSNDKVYMILFKDGNGYTYHHKDGTGFETNLIHEAATYTLDKALEMKGYLTDCDVICFDMGKYIEFEKSLVDQSSKFFHENVSWV